jgi:hypothetical protein
VSGTCDANKGEEGNVHRLLVRKTEGRRTLERQRHTWVDNIKMDLVEIGFGELDLTCVAQDRYSRRALVNTVMNLRGPSNAGTLSNGCTVSGLSSSTQLHGVSSLTFRMLSLLVL